MKLRQPFFLFLLIALSMASLAFGQTDTPVGDDPDPDALARVANSDVVNAATGGQVLRSGDHFVQDGHVFLPKGVNFELHGHPWLLWPDYWNQTSDVETELDRARRLGANVIRVFLPATRQTPQPTQPPFLTFGGLPTIYGAPAVDFNPEFLTRLDDFLGRADGHGLKVLLTLYDGINILDGACRGQIGNPNGTGPYAWENTSPDSNTNTWLHGPDIRPFRGHADQILTTMIPPAKTRNFANDPRIFGWDVMNEPDHLLHQTQGSCPVFYSPNFVNAWIGWMARHVRLYTHAPITAGTYGWYLNPDYKDRPYINFTNSALEYTNLGGPGSLWFDLDFISFHWFQPVDQQAPNVFGTALNATEAYLYGHISGGKPVLVEEIGQADNGWWLNQNVCVAQSMPGCNANVSCNRTWIHDWTARWAPIAKSYGAGSLIWTGSDFVWTSSCNGGQTNEDFFGFYDGNGGLKPAGQIYAPANYDAACTRAGFRTRDGLHWLTAQNGGGPGSRLDASGTGSSPGAYSIFSLVHTGDGLGLRILKNGTWYYVSANNGGGSYITVDRTQLQQWETFGLVYLGFVSGLGDNAVAFRTWNGPYYFSAANAGGGTMTADRTWVLPWENFQMVCQGYTDTGN